MHAQSFFAGAKMHMCNYTETQELECSMTIGRNLGLKKMQSGAISTYRSNNVFSRTFLILVILTAIMLAIFYLFSVNMISGHLKEKVYISNINMLSKTAEAIDITLANIEQLATQVSQNENVVNSAIVPDIERVERNFNTIKFLSSTVENNRMLKRIYLYLPTDGTVYSSENTIGYLWDFHDRELIEKYNGDPKGNVHITINGKITDLISSNGRIFLVRDFPFHLNNRLGTLFFEIDSEELLKLARIEGSNPPDHINRGNVYVFNPSNQPVFSNQNELSIDGMITQGENSGYFAREISGIGSKFYYYKSGFSGWTYVYPQKDTSLDISYRQAMGTLIPIFILFLAISLMFSLYITKSIYAPIKRLMSLVTNSGSGTSLGDSQGLIKNEFDFLDAAYTNVVEKEKKLSDLADSITPAVLEGMFSELLLGKEVDKDQFAGTLKTIGGKFDPDSSYAVLSCLPVSADSSPVNEIDINLYHMSIRKFVPEILNDWCRYFCLSMKESSLAIILSFPKDMSAIQINKIIKNAINAIQNRVGQLPFRIIISSGQICNNIFDIQYSYEEALEKMKYQRYLGHKDFIKKEGLTGEDEEYTQHYFAGRIKHLLSSISEDGLTKSFLIAAHLAAEIKKGAGDLNSAREMYSRFINGLMEAVMDKSYEGVEGILPKGAQMVKSLEACLNIEDMEAMVNEFCRGLVRMIDENNKGHKNKNIIRAKEYIDNNYSNGFLSLNDVAEHVGITPSYLSSIFNEYENGHFVDYLNNVRVEKAKKILKNTSLSVKDIGFKSGFNNIQNFIRVFKKHEGMTPGQYRDKSKDLYQ